ncbi:MAG: YceI family protein [Sphingobium sp.]
MHTVPILVALALVTSVGGISAAQMPTSPPGKMDTKLVTAGTYQVDPGHTQVLFNYNHMGFTQNMGIIAMPEGSMTLDPKAPAKAKVIVTFPVTNLRTGVADLDAHLMKSDFFDAVKFPTAIFESTSVTAQGTTAKIVGNLTIKGITKPVTLNATFTGAGLNSFMKKDTIGFSAHGLIKRSDFGLGYGVPVVGDAIELTITAAFEK